MVPSVRDEANAAVASNLSAVTGISALVAHCALTTANYTNLYREPGNSITDVDEHLGSKADVEDPLLASHRLAKFYLISAGDCVHSMSSLLPVDAPNFIGGAAIARSAAEHASRSLYISDPAASFRERVLRVHGLIVSSLREYRSTHDASAVELIRKWERWRSRTNREFTGVPKQKYQNATRLIQRHFPDESESSYEELSRPTHGNATWLIMTVISEQKQTAYARILLMRNAMFAARCVAAATASLATLWQLDMDDVLGRMAEEGGWESRTTWESVIRDIHALSEFIDAIDETQFVDATPDPQPRR